MSRDSDGSVTVRATRLSAPLTFDGQLAEEVYQTIGSVGPFIQQDPFEGEPSGEKTEVWVFFDDANLYVSARLWETAPERRVANEMRRDSFNLYSNDHFGVLIDTFYDRRNGYAFFVNQLGGLADAQVVNEQFNPNWNALWDARTATFEGGWTVEMRVPFRSIRFREGSGIWGINFRRLVRWANESSYLNLVPQSWGRRGMSKVSSGGTLVGLETPASLRNFEMKPYALSSLLTNRVADPPLLNDSNVELGMDAKWAISQSVVADFTYNTDFAQVEDDEAQVNLSRFSLFFPEKREFFLEGQDYFNFGAGTFTGGGGGGGGGGGRGNNPAPPLRGRALFGEACAVENQDAAAFGHHRAQPFPRQVGPPRRMRDEVLQRLIRARIAQPRPHRLHRFPATVVEQTRHIATQRAALTLSTEAVFELLQPCQQSS